MFGRLKSPKFIEQQFKDKSGEKNPMYGKTHSPETLAKIKKRIYVYDAVTKELIKVFSSGATVEAKKDLKIGYDTLKRCSQTHESYKGMIFSKEELSFD